MLHIRKKFNFIQYKWNLKYKSFLGVAKNFLSYCCNLIFVTGAVCYKQRSKTKSRFTCNYVSFKKSMADFLISFFL